MAGCAGSNCHGSIRGKEGFKLSLFGYEPELDCQAITGADGHRINLKEPENSLILRKPTMQAAHGGGFRFAVDSLEYRTILEWLRDGAPIYVPPGWVGEALVEAEREPAAWRPVLWARPRPPNDR